MDEGNPKEVIVHSNRMKKYKPRLDKEVLETNTLGTLLLTLSP